MSFKPTNLLEWILVGYGGVVLVVSLVLAPLVIGLGDDSADSSPVRSLMSWSGLSSPSRTSRRSRRRWKTRVRHRKRSFSRAAAKAPVAEPCKAAMERLISCTQDPKVKSQISKAKETFVTNCRDSSKETRKAKRCTKRSSCKAFVSCLGSP